MVRCGMRPSSAFMHRPVDGLESTIHLLDYRYAIVSHFSEMFPLGVRELVIQIIECRDSIRSFGVNSIRLDRVLTRQENLSNAPDTFVAL